MMRLTLLALLAVTLSGCSSIMGSLRSDLDDQAGQQPTTGGRWAGSGLIDETEDRPDRSSGDTTYVGRNEPRAGSDRYRPSGGDSWVNSRSDDRNEMDPTRRSLANEAGAQAAMTAGAPSKFKSGFRATRRDFVDESSNDGSLWASDGQTNYYFTRNKIRGVGDIINVTSEAELVKDIASEITRTLTKDERDQEMELAEQRSGGSSKDQVASSSAAPKRDPASSGAEKKEVGPEDIDVSASMGFKAGDAIMAEIVDRYPNGNYKVRGMKRVPYRTGFRMVNFVGIVRGSDIGDDDVVTSGKLYEYRLEALR
jgi:flagellar basal body L-ring protein FlgH